MDGWTDGPMDGPMDQPTDRHGKVHAVLEKSLGYLGRSCMFKKQKKEKVKRGLTNKPTDIGGCTVA